MLLKLCVPFQPLLVQTQRMFRKDYHYIVRPLWTNDFVCPSPFVPSTPRNDNLVRPLHILFYSWLCLQANAQKLIYSSIRKTLLLIIQLSSNSRGTQLPNLSGNSEMRSSLMRSLSGPRTITGRVYCIVNCCTASYESTFSSLPAIV